MDGRKEGRNDRDHQQAGNAPLDAIPASSSIEFVIHFSLHEDHKSTTLLKLDASFENRLENPSSMVKVHFSTWSQLAKYAWSEWTIEQRQIPTVAVV